MTDIVQRKILASDEQLLKNIQENYSSVGTDQYFCYVLDNGTFHIHIKGGELGTSEPDAMLENLSDYELISIELWDHKEPPEKPLEWEPLMFPGGPNNPPIQINFNVNIFPHTSINITTDPRFKSQPWAILFYKHSSGSKAMVRPDTLCDILRYCEKITHLKAFW